MARTSKQSDDWASLIAEDLKPKTVFPDGALTFVELQELRKSQEAPSGACSVRRWMSALRKAGKIEQLSGSIRSNGQLVRCVKYVIKK